MEWPTLDRGQLPESDALDEAFLTEANWPEAQAQWPDPYWRPRPAGPAAYWRAVREYADIGQRYAQVIETEAALHA